MRIATWNVNSLRARLDHVERWLSIERPDVLCLQETKVTDDEFPADSFARLGYEAARAGQRSYNGVAILARHHILDVAVGLWGASPTEDSRLIAGTVGKVRVFSAYVPNGKSLHSPSYTEKLAWLARLRQTLDQTCSPTEALVVCGDFNVAHDERDVFDVKLMQDQMHFTKAECAALDQILEFGLHDALRVHEVGGGLYSWWDYRMGAFLRDRGLRIDYLFVSDVVKTALRSVKIDKVPRGWEKPSDHAPVVVDFEL